MSSSTEIAGCFVVSTAGRDMGRTYVALQAEKPGIVYVADGRLHKLAAPKKKNKKHLTIVSKMDEENWQKFASGLATDSFLRRLLESTQIDHDDLATMQQA